MFLDIPLIADILAIQNNQQLPVDKCLLQANAKQINTIVQLEILLGIATALDHRTSSSQQCRDLIQLNGCTPTEL
jgi:hypothetical protein